MWRGQIEVMAIVCARAESGLDGNEDSTMLAVLQEYVRDESINLAAPDWVETSVRLSRNKPLRTFFS